MSQHPSRDDLLGLRYGLLGEAEARELEAHVDGCPSCGRALAALAEAEGAALPSSRRPRPRPSVSRILESTAAPVAVMLATVVGSALLPPSSEGAALALLAAGGVAVLAWLHALVGRTEAGFRGVERADLGGRGRGRSDDDVRRAAGAALSVAHDLHRTRGKVATVLVVAAVLALLGGAAFLLSAEALPATTAEVAASRPTLLPAAVAMGLLFGGGVWVSIRLARLGRAARAWAMALAERPGEQA